MNKPAFPFSIANCTLGERCSSQWEDLECTSLETVRHCTRCDRSIHLCATLADVVHHAGLENAVAFSRTLDYPTPSIAPAGSVRRLQ